jgi:phospho-N-acetylmuramoyl-pentapeptide-transferase
MLYYLFLYLEKEFALPGAQVFQFITFRAAMAIMTSLLISMIFGKRIVAFLRKKQVGETVRDLGLEGQSEKAGTPTMGGLIILGAIIIPTLLFAKLDNIYIILMLITTVWMGIIGFLDDYIKVFKKNKKGLAGKFKILGQVLLGLLVGAVIYFHHDVQVRDFNTIYVYETQHGEPVGDYVESMPSEGRNVGGGELDSRGYFLSHDTRYSKTTIPFTKNNEFDYATILSFLGGNYKNWGWIIFIPIVILIITAVSNGTNLTDGLDGLATGTSAIIVFTLLLFAYVSGNVILAHYLNIMYIPLSGELVVFAAAFVGACIGFLWYNAYPATVFMGDTGSLAIGGIIATLAILIRKELLIPILCGIFLMESLSVILQVGYFKYTKKRFGEGKRIFLMSPLHHHYQKLGMPETKIVVRFWIVGILLALISIVTLKIR